MGHIRLRRLPATKKWQQVVALLADGAALEEIAGASADAAHNGLTQARNDPALIHSFWLLTQIPLAARSSDFSESLRSIGLETGGASSLVDITAALSEAVDRQVEIRGGRTDFGELAQNAAAESLATIAGSDLTGLFGSTATDVRLAIGKLAAPDRFAGPARDFFARLTERQLDYYLSRTPPNHVGNGRRFASTTEHSAFNTALGVQSRHLMDWI